MFEELVTLRNGTRLPTEIVSTLRSNFEIAKNENPQAFIELFEKCNNPAYHFAETTCGDPKIILRKYCFINNEGEVPDYVKNFVLSAFKNNGWALCFFDPIKPKAPPQNAQPIYHYSLRSSCLCVAILVITAVGGIGIEYLKKAWL